MAEQFKRIKEVGRGSFGCVYQAINCENGEIVAIKAIQERYQSSDKCYNTEVKPLVKLGDHPNIIKLEHVFEDYEEGNNTLFLVFEYIHSNLDSVIRKNNDQEVNYGETEIKNWFVQLLRGLDYAHQSGYMHRDLKPSNLLVTENRDNLKIADFGSACEIDDKTACIDYVTTTRWYRAPEVLFGSTYYGPEVDMWAAGTILAELFMGRPIFPGTSSIDQIYKMCRVLGNPTVSDIYAGFPVDVMPYDFPHMGLESSAYDNFGSLIPSASEDAISLIQMLCSWNPFKRPTAAQALQHPFFNDLNPVPRSITMGCVISDLLPEIEDIYNNQPEFAADIVSDSVLRFDCQVSDASN